MTNPTPQGVTLREALVACDVPEQYRHAIIDKFNSLQPPAPEQPSGELAKHQPCGCVVCTCNDEERCHGCGAKNCGTHPPGEIPNPVFTTPTAEPAGEAMSSLGRMSWDYELHCMKADPSGPYVAFSDVKSLLSASPAAPEAAKPQGMDGELTIATLAKTSGVKMLTLMQRLLDAGHDVTANHPLSQEQTAALLAADDSNPNAPWLTEAHMLCTDAGVKPGHISDRIRTLREKLAADGKVGGEVAPEYYLWEHKLGDGPPQLSSNTGPHPNYIVTPLYTSPQQAAQVAQPLKADDVEWVVNDIAELGVKIGDQFFWLYKGYSLVYEDAKHDDGTPMMWRTVGKREFGECCHPVKFWKEGALLPNRYTEELIYTPGLSFGTPEDGKWKLLPSAHGIGKDQAS